MTQTDGLTPVATLNIVRPLSPVERQRLADVLSALASDMKKGVNGTGLNYTMSIAEEEPIG